MNIKSNCPQWLWDILHPYTIYDMQEIVSRNPYTIYNNYIFGLCAFSLFALICLSLVGSKSRRSFLALLLTLPFIMFHNMFDFIASLPKNDLPIPQEWDEIVKTIVIGNEVLYGHAMKILSIRHGDTLSSILLVIRLLLFTFTLLIAIIYIFHNVLDISMMGHLVNFSIISCSNWFFYPGVVAILHELEVSRGILLFAGRLFPLIYMLFVLSAIPINAYLRIMFPQKEMRYNTYPARFYNKL